MFRCAPLHRLRLRKSDAEIALMKHAVDITNLGFRRLLAFVDPVRAARVFRSTA